MGLRHRNGHRFVRVPLVNNRPDFSSSEDFRPTPWLVLIGHAAAFAEVKLDGHQNVTKLFTFAVRTATGAKVRV